MNVNYFDKYPELKELFENIRFDRRDEILNHLKGRDEVYANLIKNRTTQSMNLRRNLEDDISVFEQYMDFIYEQEIYDLDAVYTHAFHDALMALEKLKILQ